ncbi:MAG: endonuclease Q family protein [Candidatus Thorarchaeota archaeon]
MEVYDADLHIHSLHSIGVSKHMTLPNLATGAKEKGLDILGTGDATQPQWLNHLRRNLKQEEDALTIDNVSFILTVEIEDSESVHHLVLLRDFESTKSLRKSLRPHSPNLDHQWGGRPRVNLKAEELAGIVRDCEGLIGPAHAFTPFRAIFRESRYSSLEACYGDESPNVHFLELGLSADAEVADCIPELRRLTFLTCSDAHSPFPDKIGREFVRFSMMAPTYDELKMAILREKGRKPMLNVGFNPRLGKYYLSFCSSCRRTLVIKDEDAPPAYDNLNVYVSCKDSADRSRLLQDIHTRRVKCPSDGKPLRLGVRDRAMMIGEESSVSPSHRPPYLHIPPLLDMLAIALGVKSKSSKAVRALYSSLRESFGPETTILTDTSLPEISSMNGEVAQIVEAYRNKTVGYVPGGGGRYGTLIAPWEET